MENQKPPRWRKYAASAKLHSNQPKGPCSVTGCDRQIQKYPDSTLCNAHWKRLHQRGDLRSDKPVRVPAGTWTGVACKNPACDREAQTAGLCHKCWRVGRMRDARLGADWQRYNELLVKQDSRCAVCRIDFSKLSRSPALDHNHATMQVRGLLCHSCNRAIGFMGDNSSRLRAAANYLDLHRDGGIASERSTTALPALNRVP